ncbi:uncharacterized protein VICG_01745 [Vittaforma corneae ATCC 50505]|uniref:Uncharacterized protein n=1 Tax=Vittaforma corneae (strain ATCC 50505) TaxID=993615 RepID=L2GK83_VITCO|nr:uncharacterized protein VICG_01745 [Vittaforma corneae ATCC 50505]ELA41256.1 hypothetical protein VICG_01745 [Vittaforma corneae ATCC 50505]
MKLSITAKAKLCKPPTAICCCFDKTYIATKGRRVFFTDDMRTFKSILFSSQVNSLACSENLLFCCQKNGSVFGINSKHKTAFKTSIGESECIYSVFDPAADNLLVGSKSKKVSIFGLNTILKSSYFINESPLAYFDVSDSHTLAGISQNDQNIQFVNLKTKEKLSLRIIDGFPEILKYLKSDVLIVGSSTGVLNCFSTINMKRISFLKLGSAITAIHILGSTHLLVGTVCFIYLVDLSNFNRMVIAQELPVDGIPIGFFGTEVIYCAISRESRLGRWLKCKKGHNQLVVLSIMH